METFGKLTLALLFIFIGIAFDSFTLMKLWNWLITPSFGMEEISFISAICLAIFISFFKLRKDKNQENRNFSEAIIDSFAYILAKNILFLIFAFIASIFI